MTPTKPLSDDQLDAMLGRYLRAEAEVVGGRAAGERITTDALRRRVGGPAARRSWMLLAAALLLTSAAALGLAVGSATLREEADSTAPRPSSVTSAIRTGRACETSLPGTWIVFARWEDDAGRQNELVIHEDGAVYERVDPGPWERGALTVRLLTPAGVELVREAVLSSVEGQGCPEVRVPGARPHHVVARSAGDGGSVAGVDWGMPWEAPLLAATTEHQAIATTLGERLEDLAAWLPSSAWVDATARPYVGQWLVNIQQRYRSPDSTAPAGGDPDGTIADHSKAFGPYGRTGHRHARWPTDRRVPGRRRALPDHRRQSAAEIRDDLARTGAVPPAGIEPGWRYTVQGDPTYDVIVQLVALRPGELSCLDWRSDAAEAGRDGGAVHATRQTERGGNATHRPGPRLPVARSGVVTPADASDAAARALQPLNGPVQSSVTTMSLSAADSAPQTSPGRPWSWRISARSVGSWKELNVSVAGSKRPMALAPKSVSQTMSRSSTKTA